MPLEERAVLVGDHARRVGAHVDAGDHDRPAADTLPASLALREVLEGGALLAHARDRHLDRERLAEAHGPLEVALGVHRGPADAIDVEALAVGVALLV